ncbi:MAG TPA: hypothetical protein VFV08_14370 [Puia sp.]|nr:hypothetical protein [Puia sp.]
MRWGTVIILSGVVAAIGGGAIYYMHQVKLLQSSLSYEPIGITIDKLDQAETILHLKVRIGNKSNLEAELQSMLVNVLLNNNQVAVVELASNDLTQDTTNFNSNGGAPNILPAKGYSDIGLKVTIYPDQLEQDALKLVMSIFNNPNVKISSNGYMKIKAGFIRTTFKFAYDTTLKEILSS